MRRTAHWQPDILQPPLEHPADVYNAYLAVSEGTCLPIGRAEQGSAFGGIPQPGRIKVIEYHPLQIVPHRDFPALAALLIEVQHPLVSGIVETTALERGDGIGSADGIDENANNGTIPQLHHR